jgi:hypothetical protein
MALGLSACGGGKKIGGGVASTTSSAGTTSDQCATTTLKATEVGVTPETITVSVIADTGSPIRPGLFQGSVDAMEGWARYINEHGGLACRQVVVKALDSHLTADDTRNAIITACGNSLALVATSVIFLDDMTLIEQCKDAAGKATGIPDLAVLQTYAAQQCSPASFVMLPSGGKCPYSGTGVREFRISTAAPDYYFEKHGKDSLHGVYLIPTDLPSAISATTPLFAADKQLGIKADEELGFSELLTQSGYTPHVQKIKQHNATFVRDGGSYVSTVFLRKEAQVQGVDTVKVWDCTVQCYDERLITTGGSAVEGQYAWISFLPFEDKGHNAELDRFLKYDKKPDGFGAQAWVAGQVFAAAVNTVVAKSGPNGLTRASMFDAIRGLKNFDAGGLIAPTNIAERTNSHCLIGMQVQNGTFVRVDPVEPGTFDCDGRLVTVSLDPVAAYKG